MASFHLLKRSVCVAVLVVVPVLLSVLIAVLNNNNNNNNNKNSSSNWTTMTTSTTKPNPKQDASETTDIFGVKIERNPPESKLSLLGVTSWPKWGCSPSKFPWTFTAKETMYLLEGKVKVYCEGYDGFFEIKAGDLVEFPNGMNVTWDVTEAVSKHYHLAK